LVWKKVPHDGCVLPRTRLGQDEYCQLLRHYSFRLFLRDVIKHREGFSIADLVRDCSLASARRYLRWLVERRLVGIPSAWNVRLDGARSGRDHDVVGFQEGVCVYVETKSSPPRNFEAKQIRAFFERLETLRPQLAIFLNDTQLRMGDKIVVLFTEELRRRLGQRAYRLPVQRLDGEIFVVGGHVFIANSAPDLIGNLGVCLAHYFRDQGFHMNGDA
jgi:hypothetical protein